MKYEFKSFLISSGLHLITLITVLTNTHHTKIATRADTFDFHLSYEEIFEITQNMQLDVDINEGISVDSEDLTEQEVTLEEEQKESSAIDIDKPIILNPLDTDLSIEGKSHNRYYPRYASVHELQMQSLMKKLEWSYPVPGMSVIILIEAKLNQNNDVMQITITPEEIEEITTEYERFITSALTALGKAVNQVTFKHEGKWRIKIES